MVRIVRRSGSPGDVAPVVHLSAPPPATPVEVGLVLRSTREKAGLSLESVRSSTGVPMVDLAALEQGHLAVLHVEQAAVVGLWRYAELLGLDPGPLVGVVRASWPHPALAVGAMRGDPGGTGMPCALLAEAEGLLAAIAPRGSARDRDAEREAPLGLSETTRRQLASGTASEMLSLTVLAAARTQPAAALSAPVAGGVAGLPPAVAEIDQFGPVGPAGGSRPRLGGVAPRDDPPGRDGPDAAGPDAAGLPGAGAEAHRRGQSFSLSADEETGTGTGTGTGAGDDAGSMAGRGRRWPGHLLHVVAERFGLDEPDAEGSLVGVGAGPALSEPAELGSVDRTPTGDLSPAAPPPPPVSTAHA